MQGSCHECTRGPITLGENFIMANGFCVKHIYVCIRSAGNNTCLAKAMNLKIEYEEG